MLWIAIFLAFVHTIQAQHEPQHDVDEPDHIKCFEYPPLIRSMQTEFWLYSVSWSSDKVRVASAGWEGPARIWNASSGGLLTMVHIPDERILNLEWHPGGSKLACGTQTNESAAGKVYVVDVIGNHSTILYKFIGHTHEVTAVAWCHDGNLLASTSRDRTVRVWSLETGQELWMKNEGAEVHSVAWSPRDHIVLTGNAAGDITLRNGTNGHVLHFIHHAHSDIVTTLAWRPDSLLFASGSTDQSAKIWSTDRFTAIQSMTMDTVWTLTWSAEGARLALGSGDGSIMIWDPLSSKPTIILREDGSTVYAVAWRPDGMQLAAAEIGGSVTIWDCSPGPLRRTMGGRRAGVQVAAWGTPWAPDPLPTLAPSSFSPSPFFIAPTGAPGSVLSPSAAPVASPTSEITTEITLAPSPPGEDESGFDPDLQLENETSIYLAFGYDYGAIEIYESSGWTLLNTIDSDGCTKNSGGMSWSPNGEYLGFVSCDMLRVWDRKIDAVVCTASSNTGENWGLRWHPKGEMVATGDMNANVLLWNFTNCSLKKVLKKHSRWVNIVGWNEDGSILASGSDDATVVLWTVDGEYITTLIAPSIVVALSWAGTKLAAGHHGGCTVWDTATSLKLFPSLVMTGYVVVVTWAPDHEYLAVGEDTGTVSVWKKEGYVAIQIQSLQAHRGAVSSLRWNDAGSLLYSSGYHGYVRVWDRDRFSSVQRIEQSGVPTVGEKLSFQLRGLGLQYVDYIQVQSSDSLDQHCHLLPMEFTSQTTALSRTVNLTVPGPYQVSIHNPFGDPLWLDYTTIFAFCPPGHEMRETSLGKKCVQCSDGLYAPDARSDCVVCTTGVVSFRRDRCNPCPNHSYSLFGSCHCLPKYYSPTFDNSSAEECLACPQHAICEDAQGTTLTTLVAAQDYWKQELSNPPRFEKCSSSACRDGKCADGYEGPICGWCSPGYAQSGFNTCRPCHGPGLTRFYVSIGVCVGIVAALILLYLALRRGVRVGTGASQLASIALSAAQVNTMLLNLDIKLPPLVDQLVHAQSAVQTAPTAVSSFSCAAVLDGISRDRILYLKLHLTALIPGFALLVFWAPQVARYLWVFYKTRKLDRTWQWSPRVPFTGAVVVFTALHPSLCSLLFQVIACRQVGNEWFLSNDLSVKCYDQRYWTEIGVVVIPVFLISVVIAPIAALLYLRDPARVGGPLEHMVRGHTIKWWFFVMTLRKIVLAAITTFFWSNVPLQLLLVVTALTCFLVLQVWFQPFYTTEVNMAETFSLMTSTFVFAFANLLYTDPGAPSTEESGWVPWVMVALLIMLFLFLLGASLVHPLRKRLARSNNIPWLSLSFKQPPGNFRHDSQADFSGVNYVLMGDQPDLNAPPYENGEEALLKGETSPAKVGSRSRSVTELSRSSGSADRRNLHGDDDRGSNDEECKPQQEVA